MNQMEIKIENENKDLMRNVYISEPQIDAEVDILCGRDMVEVYCGSDFFRFNRKEFEIFRNMINVAYKNLD